MYHKALYALIQLDLLCNSSLVTGALLPVGILPTTHNLKQSLYRWMVNLKGFSEVRDVMCLINNRGCECRRADQGNGYSKKRSNLSVMTQRVKKGGGFLKIQRLCQDMIFLNLYFDQFCAHLMDIPPSLHQHFPYDSYDFTIYEQERIYCWDANWL